MLKLVVVSVLVGSVLASPLHGIGRVVNGTDAVEGEIPYIVSLRAKNSHICGASIITPTGIYTAGHCVDGQKPEYISIQYGVLKITSDNYNVIGSKAIYMHDLYNPWKGYANDVAVVLLEYPLTWSATVLPIALPEQGETPPFEQWAVLAGWGYPYTGGNLMEHLQRVDIIVYKDRDCFNGHGTVINDKYHLCAGVPEGGKGQCSGDSGGPLVWGARQWGSVSWSVKPCTIKSYPGVYARTSNFVDWINERVALDN